MLTAEAITDFLTSPYGAKELSKAATGTRDAKHHFAKVMLEQAPYAPLERVLRQALRAHLQAEYPEGVDLDADDRRTIAEIVAVVLGELHTRGRFRRQPLAWPVSEEAAKQENNPWKPIATAPRDGTPMWFAWRGGGLWKTLGQWSTKHNGFYSFRQERLIKPQWWTEATLGNVADPPEA